MAANFLQVRFLKLGYLRKFHCEKTSFESFANIDTNRKRGQHGLTLAANGKARLHTVCFRIFYQVTYQTTLGCIYITIMSKIKQRHDAPNRKRTQQRRDIRLSSFRD